MDKPDFGIDRLHVIQWTEPRLAYLRWLAGQGKSAAEIAVTIGLDASQHSRISMACARFSIPLNGRRGRRPGSMHYLRGVRISTYHRDLLVDMARKRGSNHDDLITTLLDHVCEQGETFIANLLDEQ